MSPRQLFILWDFVHFSGCGILSCGIMSCGILSVGILSCGILSVGILSGYRLYRSSQLQGLEDSDILLEHGWSCRTPNHNRPETGGVNGFPRPFSKSLLSNVLVEYAVLVSQFWWKTLSWAVGVQEPLKLVHFGVYFGLV